MGQTKRFKKKHIKKIGGYTSKGKTHTTVIFRTKSGLEMYCGCTPDRTV